MEEGKKSIWARSLLLRLAIYSVASSILITGLDAVALWNIPQRCFTTTELKLRELAGTAFGVFWIVFLLGGAILGTLNFFVSLIDYRRVVSRGEEKLPKVPGDSGESQ